MRSILVYKYPLSCPRREGNSSPTFPLILFCVLSILPDYLTINQAAARLSSCHPLIPPPPSHLPFLIAADTTVHSSPFITIYARLCSDIPPLVTGGWPARARPVLSSVSWPFHYSKNAQVTWRKCYCMKGGLVPGVVGPGSGIEFARQYFKPSLIFLPNVGGVELRSMQYGESPTNRCRQIHIMMHDPLCCTAPKTRVGFK